MIHLAAHSRCEILSRSMRHLFHSLDHQRGISPRKSSWVENLDRLWGVQSNTAIVVNETNKQTNKQINKHLMINCKVVKIDRLERPCFEATALVVLIIWFYHVLSVDVSKRSKKQSPIGCLVPMDVSKPSSVGGRCKNPKPKAVTDASTLVSEWLLLGG